MQSRLSPFVASVGTARVFASAIIPPVQIQRSADLRRPRKPVCRPSPFSAPCLTCPMARILAAHLSRNLLIPGAKLAGAMYVSPSISDICYLMDHGGSTRRVDCPRVPVVDG